MSADIRCYWDEACTDELFQETTSYSISLGPRTGLNGDTGEITDQTIYLKNVGDVTAQNTRIQEVGDLNNYFKVTTPLVTYGEVNIAVGDISPGEVKEITIHSIIPRHSSYLTGIITYSIIYYTLPSPGHEDEYTEYTLPEAKLQYSGDEIPDGSPAGRPYGYGPYGEPLYGQEGFIHKVTAINGKLPIAGLAYTYIHATFTINARYDGTEATIEDVQSYYTSRYMAMGAFDGPALPLYLNNSDEDVL